MRPGIGSEKVQYIIKHFADNTNKDLAGILGISLSCLSSVASRYHLHKSQEHSKRIHRESGLASAGLWGKIELTPEVLARRAASFRKTYRTEKARVLFGLPQKTKIRVRRQPKKLTDHRNYLIRRGYIIDDVEKIAYWTEETRRATRLEAKPRWIYYFKPLSEKGIK